MSLSMKFFVFSGIAFLGACTTYDAQTARASESEGLVVAEATADVGEVDVASAVEDSGDTQTVVKKDRIICRRTTPTGSRFSKKICKKWSDWKTMEDQARTVMEGARRRGTQGNIQSSD